MRTILSICSLLPLPLISSLSVQEDITLHDSPQYPDNCVADFTKTSSSSIGCRYSSTAKSYFFQGTDDYIKFYYPELEVYNVYSYVDTSNYGSAFEYFIEQILENHPTILNVDCLGIGVINHVVLAVAFSN